MEIVKIIVMIIFICLLIWGVALLWMTLKINEIENKLKNLEDEQHFKFKVLDSEINYCE